MAILAAVPPQALAQTTPDTNQLLMRPFIDGDPKNPQRFRPLPQGTSASRASEFPSYQYRPAFGAGVTGFDSTGRPKSKSTPKGKAAPKSGVTGVQNRAVTPIGLPPGGPSQPSTSPTSTTSGSATDDNSGASTAASPSAASTTIVSAPPAGSGNPAVTPTSGRQNQVQRPPTTAFASDTSIGGPIGQSRRKPLPDEDPFAPTGILVGGFLLRPALETTGAYDTNPQRTQTPQPSYYAVMQPELLINSNWARHELTASLRGSFTTYDETKELNRPDADLKVNGRIDVTNTSRIDLEAHYLVGTDRPGSPNIQANLIRLPVFTTLGGIAGFTQAFNRFEVSTKAGFDRTHYQNSHFDDGEVSSNADRQYNRYNGALRLSYEVAPAAKPYVEVAGDQRHYDLAIDASGVNRDSKGIAAKLGTTFEYSRLLTGELAVGYLRRDFRDPTLQSFDGLSVDGSVLWLASALTTVKLTAATSVSETTVAGVSGVFTRDFSAQVDHAFRRWLIATGKFTFGIDDYEGSPRLDKRYMASALITYKLTRELWLKSEYRHIWLNSNQPGSSYVADVFLLGVRLQR